MKKLLLIFVYIFFILFLSAESADAISTDSIEEKVSVEEQFNSVEHEIGENTSSSLTTNLQSRLNFSPPGVGEIGSWISVGTSEFNDTAVKSWLLNDYLPSEMGESVDYTGTLGSNVGDTLKLSIGATRFFHFNFY